MENLLNFFTQIGKMKYMERLGWVVEGVANPESVADHSFRTAFMILFLGKDRKDLDLNKAIKMALIHDIAESQTGDILVDWKLDHLGDRVKRLEGKGIHGVTREEKIKMEKDGMDKLLALVDADGKELMDLWKEYNDRKSKESIFVKSVDVLEMFLQAFEYEKSQDVDISSWFDHSNNLINVRDGQVKKILDFLVEKRRRGKTKV